MFPLITTDSAGKSYLRFVPAEQIVDIETAANDIMPEKRFLTADDIFEDAISYSAYLFKPKAKTVMLHYTTNKPGGAKFGEPDLGPLIP